MRMRGASSLFRAAILAFAVSFLPTAGELCVLVQLTHASDLQAARVTWLKDNKTLAVRFVRPETLPRIPTAGADTLPLSLRVWHWALQGLPQSCEWVLKVPSSSYVHLKLVRTRLQCFLGDPSLKYLGFLRKELPMDAPQLPVADERAGIILRRSLLHQLPTMLEWCGAQAEVQQLAKFGEDIVLGYCLSQHNVELASFMDPNEVLVEDLKLDASGRFSKAFARIAREYLDKQQLSLMKCLMILSGLAPKDMKEVHRLISKGERWHPGVACFASGMVRTDLKHGTGPLRRSVLEPRVQGALKDCFLSRAYAHWRSSSHIPEQHMLSAPQALAKEWIDVPAGQGKVFDRLRQGHEVCVFVLTTSASEKHRADARAIYSTWAKQPRPAGVEVFMVKDNSWALEDLTGSPEEADDVLTLRGDVDLGFLYNSVRSFLLWRYLAENHVSDCRWFVKVDADTFLNLWALEERLRRYFNASEDQYLGSLKHTHLTDGGSGSTIHFAVNAIVLSGKLLSTARTWLNSCFDDIVWRRLGQGAEDVDLGLCLKVHGYVLPKKLGQVQEMPSRNFAAVITGSSGGDLLNTKGTCTILIHPLHAEEMYQVHAKLLQARAASEQPEPCDWPEDEALSKTWSAYMAGTFNIENDRHQCWDLFFNWNLCCHERWGETGNSMCWDDENTWHRCCNRTDARNDPLPERRGSTDPAKAGRAARDIALATTTTSTSTSIARKERAIGSLGVEVFQVKNKKDTNASIVSLSSSQPKTQGNPKCWKEGFTFDLCCYSASTVDCWVWPFSRDFCCYAPLSPRAPIRSGGLRQQGPGKRPRTSRCQDLEDQSLLACQLSLDEMGVLFELPTIGSGDKASGWHDYLGVYERFLLHLPLTSDLLEFGVRMGSSLAMWSEYFPKGTVVGVDKNLATFFQTGQPVLTAHGAFTRGNVYVLEANASDVSGRQKLERLGFDRFDVVVDDANHWAKDQIARFELYFPELLRPGGAYIIEDVHMQAPWTRDGSMVREYFANLTASVYVTDEILLGAHQIRNKRQASQDWRHKVESVTFLRDMIAIAKAADAA